ncbi:MAG: c-type cytochrome [Gemmatimonadaceae bacterium]
MIQLPFSRFRRALATMATAGCAGAGLPTTLGSQASDSTSGMTGKQLYAAACQSCHAADGRGAPQNQVGFGDAIPDFTDCSYASREAAQDWFTVVHQGGPARRFSRRMPAFGKALSAAQIERVVTYVRSLCTDASWPRGELNLPRAIDTEKAFPEDEMVLTTSWIGREGERVATSRLVYEKRFGSRNQWELVVPAAVRELPPRGGPRWSSVRLGDVELGYKRAVFHNASTILSLGGELILPTGNRARGFGGGTLIYEPFILAGQSLPANFFAYGQAGVELPARSSVADKEWFARGVLGTTIFVHGRAFSPMLEAAGNRELVKGGRTSFDHLTPQVQVSLSRRQHVLANVGMRIPITGGATRPRELVAYLLWDWFDGGLLAGW